MCVANIRCDFTCRKHKRRKAAQNVKRATSIREELAFMLYLKNSIDLRTFIEKY